MKISEKLNLNKTQFELDFVDIDTERDMPLFIDSNLIRKYDSEFNAKFVRTMDSFFTYLINNLSNGLDDKAKYLCSHLSEINETHLGLSRGISRGKGVGQIGAEKMFFALKNSKAIEDGVLKNIEDLRVLVNGFDKDMLSDMLTNILKKHLLEYTINQCNLLGIKLTHNVPSGYFWNENTLKWENEYIDRLIIDDKPVLLVPKKIVNYTLQGSSLQYRQHFVLNYLQDENIKNMTSLVQQRKGSKEFFVTKKDIIETEEEMNKDYLSSFTMNHPEVLEDFKKTYLNRSNCMSGNMLEEISIDKICDILINRLKSIPVGTEFASDFHNIMIGIFELLFYPNLINPKKEKEINDGRKRIDICFTNVSEHGFFTYIPEKVNIPCPFLFIECKNYSSDVRNPELDQLAGRFSTRRGRLGLLSCRKIDNEELFLKRCVDTFKDDNGLIIPITDDDIIQSLESYGNLSKKFEEILYEKSRKIITG